MSAYIVDPRTIDYLVQYAHRHRHDRSVPRATLPNGFVPPADLLHAISGDQLHLAQVTANDLGQILLGENVRSVQTRYPNDAPDDLPGPNDKRNVFAYRFRPIVHHHPNPVWVLSSLKCLEYQSCETDDYRDSLAYAVCDAIKADAIRQLTQDAPWGVTDEDLKPPAPRFKVMP